MSGSTLNDIARAVFSKTARSRPGQGEAGWAGGDRSALPRFGRRLTDDLPKAAAEAAQAVEADVEADVGHAAVGRAQEEHRALDPPTLQITVRGLAEGGSESPDEVRLRDIGDLRESVDIERFCVGSVHRIPGAQHPPVGLLD